MILNISIENFKSICHKKVLNFISNSDKEHSNSLLKSDKIEQNILPALAIYGANSAGKTNLLHAFSMFKLLINESIIKQEGDKISHSPFKIDETYLSKPTTLEVLFLYGGVKYFYGFSYDKWQILEEFLYYYPNNKQATIFERVKNKYTFTNDKTELNVLSKRTLKNRLFFSTASEWNYEKIKRPFRYLKESIVIYDNYKAEEESWKKYTFKRIKEDVNFKNKILQILNDIDSDILDISVEIEKMTFNESNLPNDLPKEIREMFINKEGEASKIRTTHIGKDINGNATNISFSLQEESRGINKFLELIGPWIDILEKGKCLIIDEIESSLHPFIVKYLIDMFMNPAINKNNAQIVYSTHNTSLLNLDHIRRDQIWLVEKDHSNMSDIYSLSDLKGIRKDENIQKGYLRGKYGAIPLLKCNLEDI